MAQEQNPYYVAPAELNIQPLLTGIGSMVKQTREATKAKEAQTFASEALQSGDPKRIADAALKYPELSQAMSASFGFTNDATKKISTDAYRRALSDPANASQYIQQGIQQVTEAGGRPDMMSKDFQMLQENPEGALKAMAAGYAGVDPEGYKTLFGDGKGKTGEVVQKQVNVLRKGIQDVTKTFRTTEEATKRIRSVGKKGTAASDMAVVFSFMKILDPGSTVREGEFATAQNAAGIPERVVNAYNNARAGTILGDDQRNDFLNQAESLYESQRASTDNQIDNLLQQADQDEIDRGRIFGKKRLSEFNERQSIRASEQEIADAQAAPVEPQALPPANAQGWPLMTDAQGNRAYVSPNGEVEEVQ